MPVLSDEATVSHRLQLSIRALVFCCSCLFATLFGAIAITVSFRLVVDAHAGSARYWSIVAALLFIWLTSFINMCMLAIREVREGGDEDGGASGSSPDSGVVFAPVPSAARHPVLVVQVSLRR